MRYRQSFRSTQPPVKKQGGFALLMGVILILIMTVFGVFAMKGSIMQERMAGNTRDHKVAFEASEIALRWGEAWLQSRTPVNRPFPCQTLTRDLSKQNCTDPRQVLDVNLLSYDVEDQDPWAGTGDWGPDTARAYGIDPGDNQPIVPVYSIPGVAQQPLILMEQSFVDRDDLAGNPQQGRIFYRIIAAASGARPSTIAVGESAVAKRFE